MVRMAKAMNRGRRQLVELSRGTENPRETEKETRIPRGGWNMEKEGSKAKQKRTEGQAD